VNGQVSQKTAAIALGVLAAVILVAGVAFVVMPQRSHESRIDKQTAAAKLQLADIRAAAAVTTPPVSVRATDLFRLSEAMPDDVRMPAILVQLASLAQASHLEITSIKPSTAVPLSGYSAIPLAVTVTGKYAALTGFARRVRDMVVSSTRKLVVTGRLLDVNAVALTSADGRTVSATLNLDAFSYVPAAPVPAGTATTTPGGST
jgi:Tfp pilus assembly protein PilO